MTALRETDARDVMTDFGHGLKASIEAAERFHALPASERERILNEFRAAFADAFASTEDYLKQKRRENARED